VISRSDETIVTNQVYKKDGLFFSQGKLYTGNLRTNYSSGKVKYEWHIENGLLNGKCVGYYE
jgi:antitoxin component YwqK of YwqJK toxin-antitoxin module